MAGGATYYTAGEILDFVLRAVSPTISATVYLRLLTSPSTKGTSGTETAYGAYTRLALVRGTSLFTAPLLTGRSTNVSALIFPAPTTLGAGDLVAFDIVNTSTGAFTETYLYGSITPSRTVVVGKVLRFPAGTLLVTA